MCESIFYPKSVNNQINLLDKLNWHQMNKKFYKIFSSNTYAKHCISYERSLGILTFEGCKKSTLIFSFKKGVYDKLLLI